MNGSSLDYDEETAQWQLKNAEGVLADDVDFEILLSYGRTLNARNLPPGKVVREQFEDDRGRGTHYTVEFPDQDGVKVQHRVTMFRTIACLEISVSLENTGDTPLHVSHINPMVLRKDITCNLRTLGKQRLNARGGIPIYDLSRPSIFTAFNDRRDQPALRMAILPGGRAQVGMDFDKGPKGLQGAVFNRFEPALALAPGETLESDSLWLAHGFKDPARADLNFAWAFGALPHTVAPAKTRFSWVTVDSDEDQSSLLRAAQSWKRGGIHHALIPASWATVPPVPPGDVLKAVRSLQSNNITAGITLDPLVNVKHKNAPWSAPGGDGRAWLDLSSPGGKKQAEARIRRLVKTGAGFLVIEPSGIPTDILERFGLTRAEAERLAFEIVSKISRLPVFPATAATLDKKAAAWNEANDSVNFLTPYYAIPGPVRLEMDGATELSPAAATAMAAWPGPIEVMGIPKAGVLRDFKKLVAH
jgi:hypothetical protein